MLEQINVIFSQANIYFLAPVLMEKPMSPEPLRFDIYMLILPFSRIKLSIYFSLQDMVMSLPCRKPGNASALFTPC